MRKIKSEDNNIPEKVKAHITDYFKRVIKLIGENYDPEESGWSVLLEKEDPLIDVTFLGKEPGIKRRRTLISCVKEFDDYNMEPDTIDVFVLYNDNFRMIFLIPKESWIGEELLNQLTSQLKNDHYNKFNA